MAIPTSYTEESLAEYMHNLLGEFATVLNFSVPLSYIEAVNDAIAKFGVDSVDEITGRENIMKLRAFARLAIWQTIAYRTAGHYSFSADGGNFNREQVFKHALENVALAESAVLQYDPSYQIIKTKINFIHDPYTYQEEDGRPL